MIPNQGPQYCSTRVDGEKLMQEHCFGVKDARGREIGTKVWTWELDFVPSVEGAMSVWDYEPGHYYAFVVHATRNGHTYGACQYARFFVDKIDRQLAMEQYLAGARKRALKLNGEASWARSSTPPRRRCRGS